MRERRHCRRRKKQATKKRSARCFVVCGGTIIRCELQPLNDRAGGQMENASPVYISVWNWVMYANGWSLTATVAACDAASLQHSWQDRSENTLCVGIRERKTRRVWNWSRNKAAITSSTFLGLLFLSRRGHMSFFFIASLRFPLKTDHLIDSVALTHSFWRLLYANTTTSHQKRQHSWEETTFKISCLLWKCC